MYNFSYFIGVLLRYNTWVPVISQVFGYWLNQMTKILVVSVRSLRILFYTKSEKNWPFINKPLSKNSCTVWTKWPIFWPFRPEFLEFFTLQNPHILQKKKFPVQFYVFWPTLKPDIQFEEFIFWKRTHGVLLQNVSRFWIYYQKCVWMMLNWLLFFGVKNVPKFQHFAALQRVPK